MRQSQHPPVDGQSLAQLRSRTSEKWTGFAPDVLPMPVAEMDFEIELILDKQQVSNYFAEIKGGDSAPCLKPDPCAINELLKKYRIAAGRALYIGDMTIDMETGQNAGVLTCAVTYGFHDAAALKQATPDFLVGDLLELEGYIV